MCIRDSIFFRLIKSRHCFHMVTQLMLQGTCLLNGAAHLGGAIGGEPILQLHCLKFGAFPQKPCIPAHHQAAEGQDQRGPRVLLLPESINRLDLVEMCIRESPLPLPPPPTQRQ